MSTRKMLVLLVVFAGLCGGYWLMLTLERHATFERTAAKKLFAISTDDVTALEIQRVGEPLASASRSKGGAWSFVKPNPTIEANQIVWNRAAGALSGLSNERTIDEAPSDPAKYGLDKPVLTVRATTADGASIQIVFGAIEPTQNYRYARVNDGPVVLASVKSFFEMDRSLDLLRVPYVVTIGEKGVNRLEFARYWTGKEKPDKTEKPDAVQRQIGEESVVAAVEKDAGGRWRVVSPIQADADQEMVNELVKQLQYATGHAYVEEPGNLADYGLEPPRARVTVFCPDREPQTLLFGSASSKNEKEEGGIFAKQEARPAVFVMDPQALTLLPKSPDGFRLRRLFTHQASDIQSFRYVSAEDDFTIENDAEKGWKIAGLEYGDTDQAAVSNFLSLLKLLEARGFPGDTQPSFGLDTPVIAMTFTFRNDPASATIRVGAKLPDVDRYYATQDTGTAILLNSNDVRAVTKNCFDFRKGALLEFARGEAIRIALTFEGVDYVFEKPRGLWRLKEPANRVVSSPGDIEALAETLASLHAMGMDSATTPEDLAPYGLDNPIAVATVTTLKPDSGGPEVTVGPVKIGATTPNESQRRFAVSEGRPGLYRVKQAVIDDIREILGSVR